MFQHEEYVDYSKFYSQRKKKRKVLFGSYTNLIRLFTFGVVLLFFVLLIFFFQPVFLILFLAIIIVLEVFYQKLRKRELMLDSGVDLAVINSDNSIVDLEKFVFDFWYSLGYQELKTGFYQKQKIFLENINNGCDYISTSQYVVYYNLKIEISHDRVFVMCWANCDGHDKKVLTVAYGYSTYIAEFQNDLDKFYEVLTKKN